MAESAWRFFRSAKVRLMGNLDLNADVFTLHYYTSGSNITSALNTASTRASITSELTASNNYTLSGFTLSTPNLSFSGSVVRWDAGDHLLTASGGAFSQIRFALIEQSNIPICYAELSTAGINVTAGNTITLQFAASGICELTGGET